MTPEQIAALIAAGVPDEVREVPTLRALNVRVDEVDEDARTVVSVINTPAVDRYRTKILPKGRKLDNYLKNPVVLFNHDAQSAPIGRNLWIKYRKSKDDLIAKTFFATDPFSDELFEKVRGGFLSAWSIRFEPDYAKCGPPTDDEVKADKALKDCWYVYRAWELLEYSLVTLPGNADCLTIPGERSLKIPDDARKYLADLSAQAIVVRGADMPTRDDDGAPIRAATDAHGNPVRPNGEPLPSLRGAITYHQYLAATIGAARNLDLRGVAEGMTRDTIDRARGRV